MGPGKQQYLSKEIGRLIAISSVTSWTWISLIELEM